MKRFLLVLLALLALSCAQAQNSYFGLRLAYTPIDFFGTQLPLFGFQLGVPIANNLAFRGTLDTIVLLSLVQVDLLYSVELSGDLSGYVGGRPDVTFVDMFRYPSAAVHGTAGLEHRTGRILCRSPAYPSQTSKPSV